MTKLDTDLFGIASSMREKKGKQMTLYWPLKKAPPPPDELLRLADKLRGRESLDRRDAWKVLFSQAALNLLLDRAGNEYWFWQIIANVVTQTKNLTYPVSYKVVFTEVKRLAEDFGFTFDFDKPLTKFTPSEAAHAGAVGFILWDMRNSLPRHNPIVGNKPNEE